MRAIIDTSSLVALARNYLPFDKDDKLKNFIRVSFEKGELIVIDKVAQESKGTAKGIVLKNLEFISGSRRIVNTETALPSDDFFKRLENEFCNTPIRSLREITNTEFDLEKQKFINGADAKMILYALKIYDEYRILSVRPLVISEETGTFNDGKLFKKIPAICRIVGVDCCTLPEYFMIHLKIKLSEYLI